MKIVEESSDKNEDKAASSEWETKSHASPLMWPYGLRNLLKMQEKWSEIIKLYLANHMPPKMACLIGTIWNVFSKDHKIKVANLLSLIIIKEWIKKMLKLVMINSGAAFQMNGEKKQVAEYFIKLLCENIWIKNE